jgi:hypothetical protein
VNLENLLVDPLAVDQVITGVSFVLNLDDTNAVSLVSSSGRLILTPVDGSAPKNDSLDTINHWGVSSSASKGSTTITLTAFTGSGPPLDGIIGNPGSNGEYNNANSSITNGHAAPFILQDGTFSLCLPGVTASTTISQVMFTVGTTDTKTINSASLATPEPGSISLMIIGALLIGAGSWRRRGIGNGAKSEKSN